MEVYNKLGKADELLPLAKREQYMFTFRGQSRFFSIHSDTNSRQH